MHSARRPWRAAAAAMALLAAMGLGACTSPGNDRGGEPYSTDPGYGGVVPPSREEALARPSTIFGAGPVNPFVKDISKAPLDPNSRYLMDNIKAQIAANLGAVPVNTKKFGSSLVVAGADTPRVDVRFDNCQRKETTPADLYSGPAYFRGVPVPGDAAPAAGTDAALAIWSPATDQLWEFWIMKRDGTTWSACWGGRIDGVHRGRGAFPHPYGASASGLATVGTAITAREGRDGAIGHAMSLGLRSIAAEGFRPLREPANRTDGKDRTPAAVPMGTRLRLDPTVDVAALHLTPLGAAIARAAQRFGFIVTESSGVVAVGAESAEEEKARTGTDPWAEVLAGKADYSQLDGFPWDKVSVVQSR